MLYVLYRLGDNQVKAKRVIWILDQKKKTICYLLLLQNYNKLLLKRNNIIKLN